VKQLGGQRMILTGKLQAVDDLRQNGFVEFTGEVETFLIGQLRALSDYRGERLERVAGEAKIAFAD
jgi:hypothetical protein